MLKFSMMVVMLMLTTFTQIPATDTVPQETVTTMEAATTKAVEIDLVQKEIWNQYQSQGNGTFLLDHEGNGWLYLDMLTTNEMNRRIIVFQTNNPTDFSNLGITEMRGDFIVNSYYDEKYVHVICQNGQEFIFAIGEKLPTMAAPVIPGAGIAAWSFTGEFLDTQLNDKLGFRLESVGVLWMDVLHNYAYNGASLLVPPRPECTNCEAGGKGASSCSITDKDQTRSVSCVSGNYACCKHLQDGKLSAICCGNAQN